MASFSNIRKDVDAFLSEISATGKELAELDARVDDAENRSRRNILIFFVVPDEWAETWSQSETSVTSLCSQKLSLDVGPNKIERAHHIGKTLQERNQPFVVRLSHFKGKGKILAKGVCLKNAQFSVGEYLLLGVCKACKHLLRFARAQSSPFTLRYNKLKLCNQTYYYDCVTRTVKPCTT